MYTVWLSFYSIIRCIALSDLTGDGDSKLVVADLGSGNYNMKLRVYKGTQLVKVLSNFYLFFAIHNTQKFPKPESSFLFLISNILRMSWL